MKTTEKKVEATPGPWNISQFGDSLFVCPSAKYERNICKVTPGEYQDANARLIAASPKLLKALEGLTAYFAFMVKDPQFHEYTEAVEAIKEAKGQ